MKKYLRIIFGMVLAAALLCTTAFAVEARWSNVASIGPSISANDGCYLSVVNGLSGTTKIDCTLILYEKGWFGWFHKFVEFFCCLLSISFPAAALASVAAMRSPSVFHLARTSLAQGFREKPVSMALPTAGSKPPQ